MHDDSNKPILLILFRSSSSYRKIVTETGELAAMAPVGRELMLKPGDQKRFNGAPAIPERNAPAGASRPWIDNLPVNFSGRVTMLRPEYRVEVSVMTSEEGASSDDKTMLPLDSEIRLQARDPDYAYVTHRQCRLSELIEMCERERHLPRIVRIVGWDEVSHSATGILIMVFLTSVQHIPEEYTTVASALCLRKNAPILKRYSLKL